MRTMGISPKSHSRITSSRVTATPKVSGVMLEVDLIRIVDGGVGGVDTTEVPDGPRAASQYYPLLDVALKQSGVVPSDRDSRHEVARA